MSDLEKRVASMLKDTPASWSRNTWRGVVVELMALLSKQNQELDDITEACDRGAARLEEIMELHPRDEWGEEDGDVIWHRVPIVEPPYIGHPNSSDWPECQEGCLKNNASFKELCCGVRKGYYTHWQRLPPVPKSAHSISSGGTHAD